MYTGRVIGSIVATIKDSNVMNIPFLAVRLIENGKEKGIVIAADSTRLAGVGDFVNMIGSKEAARMFRKQNTPVDVAIVGFIDHYNEKL